MGSDVDNLLRLAALKSIGKCGRFGRDAKRMEKGEEEMLAIRNFGKKSLDELVDKLREKNYLNVPGVDLSAFWNSTSSSSDDGDESEEDAFAEMEGTEL